MLCANSYAPNAMETTPSESSQCSSDSGFSGANAPFTVSDSLFAIALYNCYIFRNKVFNGTYLLQLLMMLYYVIPKAYSA